MAANPTEISRIEDDLRPIDALCKRWWDQLHDRPQGTLHPIARAMLQAAGAGQPGFPPPVSDEVVILDRILADSEPRYLILLRVWYGYNDSIVAKAKALSMSRDALYQRWRRSLEYLRGRMHGEGVKI